MRANQNKSKLWSVLILSLGLIVTFFIFYSSDFVSPINDVLSADRSREQSSTNEKALIAAPDSIPDYVRNTYNFILKHGDAPHGYYGGKTFQNREKRLPLKTARGQSIHYREWDVHPRREGTDRGAERLVTGSDESAWFTADHYNTFILIERKPNGK